ncbi:MAG: SDR family NAD(P)-dependent oxidoreductase [Rhizobium sp.]|nr:MAG: SDR family NAD(P)-dependent oxidoreductase [Rhizobium sp.]
MNKWTKQDIPSLKGKTAIVTGANSGLGLETSAELARAGATVIMACRDPRRAEGALAEVRSRAPKAKVSTMALDLADLKSIRAFAAAFKRKHKKLHILCNNAGVMHLPYQKTRDGFEMQMGTNHLGHFALTGLLFDLLDATPGARIVSVASVAHLFTRGLNLNDINWERRPYNKADAYGKSKLANLMFHYELTRRLKNAGSRAMSVAAHPGYSATNIGFGSKEKTPRLKRLAMNVGNRLIAQPAHMGALPTLYAATVQHVQPGDYIGPDGWFMQFRGYPKNVAARPAARDPRQAAALWALSEELTGVKFLAPGSPAKKKAPAQKATGSKKPAAKKVLAGKSVKKKTVKKKVAKTTAAQKKRGR